MGSASCSNHWRSSLTDISRSATALNYSTGAERLNDFNPSTQGSSRLSVGGVYELLRCSARAVIRIKRERVSMMICGSGRGVCRATARNRCSHILRSLIGRCVFSSSLCAHALYARRARPVSNIRSDALSMRLFCLPSPRHFPVCRFRIQRKL